MNRLSAYVKKVSWRSILQMISVISWVIALIWVVTQPGFEAMLSFFAGISTIITSFFVSDNPIFNQNELIRSTHLLDKIEFGDPNKRPEWKLSKDKLVDNPPEIIYVNDGFWGKIAQIEASFQSRADVDVKPHARFGNIVRLAIKQKSNETARFYIRISLKSQNKSTIQHAWLNCPIEKGHPYKHADIDFEYIIPMQPIQRIQEWMVFELNLRQIVKKTFGEYGWQLDQIKEFRIRGSLQLAYIHVCEAV